MDRLELIKIIFEIIYGLGIFILGFVLGQEKIIKELMEDELKKLKINQLEIHKIITKIK